ncbi:TadE/TadG family type IV pilus assembly protein [Sphingomonas sp. UNC305MFCol5.2]|uniref:TadE/TadG family type IV pilus assembly protein n=1 Tax=Sphingomonas sp. UNC305MFCol5.2 TaxID=1449076 RepID=UPI0003F7BA9A|nr:TadE/TadG family type IV pilus assembly protein [Sphingomonas sp. UNC305MFCol5.2]
MSALAKLLGDRRGSTAAEFGMVAPLLIAFLIGTIDVGRFLWECNRAEKATQMGARFAVATNMVPTGLSTYSFAVSGSLVQGDPIPASAFGGATCSSTGGTVTCSCDSGQVCPTLTPVDTAAFTNIVNRMQLFYPAIAADNVTVAYKYSGLGFAGDPNGSDVAPLVTVKLQNITFTPMLFRFFGSSSVTLPNFNTALTLEDGIGNVSD